MHGIPVITSAAEPNGPNGALIGEIQQGAPQAIYVPRGYDTAGNAGQ